MATQRSTPKDPVCGMSVSSDKPAEKVDLKGQTYHFCSSECKTEFEKHPDKYIQGADKHGPVSKGKKM